jgi:hypothetical protein
MSEQLVERVRSLDDFQCVRFFTHFSQKLFDDININKEQLLMQVPDEIRNTQELSPAFNISNKTSEVLEVGDAVICARNTLEVLAQHPGFEEAIEQALDEYRDDDMFADVILALGLAASMIIVAATTKFSVKIEGGKITGEFGKEVASPSLVKSILGSLVRAASQIMPSQ